MADANHTQRIDGITLQDKYLARVQVPGNKHQPTRQESSGSANQGQNQGEHNTFVPARDQTA